MKHDANIKLTHFSTRWPNTLKSSRQGQIDRGKFNQKEVWSHATNQIQQSRLIRSTCFLSSFPSLSHFPVYSKKHSQIHYQMHHIHVNTTAKSGIYKMLLCIKYKLTMNLTEQTMWVYRAYENRQKRKQWVQYKLISLWKQNHIIL